MSFAKEVAMTINLCCLNTDWKFLLFSFSGKKKQQRYPFTNNDVQLNRSAVIVESGSLHAKGMHEKSGKSGHRDNFKMLSSCTGNYQVA